MKIHINGMGLVGCFLALRFEAEGWEFTWSDPDPYGKNDNVPQAWKASTGCAYPSGDPTEFAAYERIRKLVQTYRQEDFHIRRNCEQALYAYLSKGIPHDGAKNKLLKRVDKLDRPFGNADDLNQFNFLNYPSIHLNAQEFVPDIRRIFSDRFSENKPEKDRLIVNSSGFLECVRSHVVWGWNVVAPVSYGKGDLYLGSTLGLFSKEFGDFDKPNRICFNLQTDRYSYHYIYPCPRTDLHYIGTSMIFQKRWKPLEVAPKVEKLFAKIYEVFGKGNIKIGKVVSGSQGWRPVSKFPPDYSIMVEENGRKLPTIQVLPQGANGWRMHPVYCDAVVNAIKTFC